VPSAKTAAIDENVRESRDFEPQPFAGTNSAIVVAHIGGVLVGEAAGDRVLIEDFIDGLGVRRRTTDSSGRLVDVLALRDDLLSHTCFEFALRERVLRLRDFHHPAFLPVVSVNRVAPRSVTITSAAAEGVRLSDIVGSQTAANFPWSVRAVARLIRALAALHALGPGIAHGAVCSRRVTVTQDSEVFVSDYVLGSSLEQLRYPHDQYRAELDVALPMRCDGFDYKVDVFQAALVALELLAGRRLTDAERRGEATTGNLLATLVDAGFERERAALGTWLARALHLEPPFGSSAEARDEIDAITSRYEAEIPFAWLNGDQLPSGSGPDGMDMIDRELELSAKAGPAAAVRSPFESAAVAIAGGVTAQPGQRADLVVAGHQPSSRRFPLPWKAVEPQQRNAVGLSVSRRFQITTLAAFLVVVVLGGLFYAVSKRTAAPTNASAAVPSLPHESSDPAPGAQATSTAGHTDLRPAANADTAAQTPSAIAAAAEIPTPHVTRPAAATVPNGPAASDEHPGTGFLAITSPIEFEVFEHGRLIADSDRRRATLAAGPHDLVFVNDALGFRMTKRVNVTEARSTTIALDTLVRLVAINADPWADVEVDGHPVGQTPLGSVPIAVGVHDVVFRHPSLGEQRRVVRIPATGEVRVSVHMN